MERKFTLTIETVENEKGVRVDAEINPPATVRDLLKKPDIFSFYVLAVTKAMIDADEALDEALGLTRLDDTQEQ